jgi:iron complex outermembrane receptor protein
MGETAHPGFRGFLTGIGGTGNGYGGGGAGFEYGRKNWMLWGGGGNQKTVDYRTPIGVIHNSGTRISTGSAGLSFFNDRSFLSASYQYDDGRYGIPANEEEHVEEEQPGEEHHHDHLADIDYIRRNIRFSGAVRNIESMVNSIRVSLNYSGWLHQELEKTDTATEVGTVFNNKQYSYQAYLDQGPIGRMTGTFGVSGMHRDYRAQGAEALTPPVDQDVFAAFALEEIEFNRFKLQFGGRLENTRYHPLGLPDRSFTGVSGSIGVHVPVWVGGAVVANFTHSYRAPALEELYNFGPHLGNLTFEVGNAALERERSDGLDLSVRHTGNRARIEGNFYYYDLGNFVYLAPTGDLQEDLTVADYAQAGSRFVGTEVAGDFAVHPNLWINTGLDYVNAALKDTATPLPRIPPLRGRFGFDVRYRGLSVKPSLIMVNAQERIFPTETRTAGYTVVDLNATYTLPQAHFSHHFAVNVFNIGDRLYRNHVSFIKNIAPEIGRGVRVTYSMKFF